MNDSVIEATDFRKIYGDVVAVDGVSFDVQQGEIFGLLGPNGAGKTSTLESLEGLRAPDGGSLRVAGVDPTRERQRTLLASVRHPRSRRVPLLLSPPSRLNSGINPESDFRQMTPAWQGDTLKAQTR
jgi:ABC-type Fe3+/spermidine/putrescine transport system ATPase subunit